jgi:hypothetical protein
MNPLFIISLFLIMASPVAGSYGLDRYVLPKLGTRWQPEAVPTNGTGGVSIGQAESAKLNRRLRAYTAYRIGSGWCGRFSQSSSHLVAGGSKPPRRVPRLCDRMDISRPSPGRSTRGRGHGDPSMSPGATKTQVCAVVAVRRRPWIHVLHRLPPTSAQPSVGHSTAWPLLRGWQGFTNRHRPGSAARHTQAATSGSAYTPSSPWRGPPGLSEPAHRWAALRPLPPQKGRRA